MTMTTTAVGPTTEDLMKQVAELRRELFETKEECSLYRAQLEGDLPRATAFLQSKVWRQRQALDRLQNRVVGQRFVLSALERLGRGLSKDEYLAARSEVTNEQTRARIEASDVH